MEELKLYEGRPADCTGRLEKEIRTYDLLDKLGMVWEKYAPWQERYDLALAYKTEHGDLEIPSVYKTADGVWLGSWVNRQRQALNSGSSALSSERR